MVMFISSFSGIKTFSPVVSIDRRRLKLSKGSIIWSSMIVIRMQEVRESVVKENSLEFKIKSTFSKKGN